jgi:transposase
VRQLWRELTQQGYTGGLTAVAQFLADHRRELGLPPRTRQLDTHGLPLPVTPPQRLTPRRAAWLVLSSPDKLQAADRERIHLIQGLHPDLQTAVDLARESAVMLRQRLSQRFDAWLERAASSTLPAFHSFGASLRRDYAAVKAGLSLIWSNGQTEGQVNRLKFVKRQMYGRANLDLLRLRVLFAG